MVTIHTENPAFVLMEQKRSGQVKRRHHNGGNRKVAATWL